MASSPSHTKPPNPWGISRREGAALDAIIATGSVKGAARLLVRSVGTVSNQRDAAKKKLNGRGSQISYFIVWDRWRRANPEPEPFDRTTATVLLSAAAKSGDPGAIGLAAQLAGVPPCDGCGFVRNKCRCPQPAPQGVQP